jgi:hypothetical protein
MADHAPRKPGRPRLDATDPSTVVCVRFPSRRYDLLYKKAAEQQLTVPELIRRLVTRRPPAAGSS